MTNLPLSNLPLNSNKSDSSDTARRFFTTYYETGISVPSNIVDSTVGFFVNKGFEETAAQSIATVLISQSKIDNVNVFTLLDTLKGLNSLQLSLVVTNILNYNRLKISTLAKSTDTSEKSKYEYRNILP